MFSYSIRHGVAGGEVIRTYRVHMVLYNYRSNVKCNQLAEGVGTNELGVLMASAM